MPTPKVARARPRGRADVPRRSIRRSDILARAAHLMQEKGYAGISAQDVADALNFSKANFFYHVRSKENLLYEIFVETLAFTIKGIETIIGRDARSADKLRAIVDLYVRLAVERRAVMQVWFKEKGHLTRGHTSEVDGMERRIKTLLHRLYDDGVREGAFKAIDAPLAVQTMIGMCFSLTRCPNVQERDPAPPKLIATMQDMVCGALLTAPAPARGSAPRRRL
jgi:TetR/AcrR family transcriptional regulator, cholesterol catabolism regulator